MTSKLTKTCAGQNIGFAIFPTTTFYKRMEESNKPVSNSTKMFRRLLKITGIIILGFALYSMLNTLRSDGFRSIYCLSEGRCVTVWKRANGEVFVIPGRYESNDKPTGSHIRTIHEQSLTLFFSNEKDLADQIVVKDEGNLETNQKRYKIVNDVNGEWEFLEYSESYKSILYEPNATKFKDVKEGTTYMAISIPENFAVDKSGKKLR